MMGLHGALAQEISGIVLHVTLAKEIPVPSVYPLASSCILTYPHINNNQREI